MWFCHKPSNCICMYLFWEIFLESSIWCADFTSRVSSCILNQKWLFWRPTFFICWNRFGPERRSPWELKGNQHCDNLDLERREMLAKDSHPWGSLWTRAGRRKRVGWGMRTWSLESGPSTLSGGKNQHEKRSTQWCGDRVLVSRSPIQEQDLPPRPRSPISDAQCEGFSLTAECKSPMYLSSNTRDSIPNPKIFWDSEGHLPLYGPTCLKAIPSNSISGDFNSNKIGQGKTFSFLMWVVMV